MYKKNHDRFYIYIYINSHMSQVVTQMAHNPQSYWKSVAFGWHENKPTQRFTSLPSIPVATPVTY